MGGVGWGIRQQQDLSGDDPLVKMPQQSYAPRTPVNGPAAAPRRNQSMPVQEDDDLRVILKRVLMGIAGVAVVGMLAMLAPRIISMFTTVQYRPISLPATLSGGVVMPDSSWSDVSSSLKTNLSSEDGVTSTASAVYGAANNPQFILVAEQGQGVTKSTSKDALDQFASMSNYVATDSQMTTQSVNGTAYTCAPIAAGSTPTAACTWVNGQLRGFAWSVNSADPGYALKLAEAANPAISQ